MKMLRLDVAANYDMKHVKSHTLRLSALLIALICMLLYLIVQFFMTAKGVHQRPRTEGENIDRELRVYALATLEQPLEPFQLREYSIRLRMYGRLFDKYEMEHPEYLRRVRNLVSSDARNDSSNASSMQQPPITASNRYPGSPILWKLEHDLFPWAHQNFTSLLELKQSYTGRGLIITTGSRYVNMSVHLIRHLRYLRFPHPIIIYYNGPHDLKPWELEFLKGLQVPVFDLSKTFNVTGVSKYFNKVFSLLASPFEEVIISDADNVFIQSPDVLFDDPGYISAGMLLFKDRHIPDDGHCKKQRAWMNANLPQPLSTQLCESRIYKMHSKHDIESGVVVVNKRRRFLTLLAASHMNTENNFGKIIGGLFLGDKETFIIGADIANQTWSDTEYCLGYISPGQLFKGRIVGKEDLVDGKMAHFDRKGNLIWFQPSVCTSKHSHEGLRSLYNMTYYARGPSCNDDNRPHEAIKIKGELKKRLDDIAELYVPEVENTLTEFDHPSEWNGTYPEQKLRVNMKKLKVKVFR